MASDASSILSLHTWASVRSELLWIYERAVIPSSRSMETDFLHGQRAWLIRRGTASVKTRRGHWTASKGEWMFPPAEKARQEFSKDAKVLSLNFACRWPDGAGLFEEKEALVVKSRDFPQLEKRAAALLRLVSRNFGDAWIDYASYSSSAGVFFQLQRAMLGWIEVWSAVQEQHGRKLGRALPDDARLARAVLRLNECSPGEPYPSEDLERITGLGISQIDRLFLQAYQITPKRYHQRRRIEQARLLLGTSRIPVKEVAFRLGFRHAAHFTIWFAREEGCSPTVYRNRHMR
jgi:AraC-like DNA-binding protein